MKLLVDMNLSPEWCPVLAAQSWESLHWSTVGDPRATDDVIMTWAGVHRYVLFTHDLDFGALLAVSGAGGPSVVQVRTHDITPSRLGPLVVATIHEHAAALEAGALITIDEGRARVRILPIHRQGDEE